MVYFITKNTHSRTERQTSTEQTKQKNWSQFAVPASKTIKAPACFPTSVPLRSLGIYLSSVICTVRPKSTSTALSDIRTMLLAGGNREKRSHCHILMMKRSISCVFRWLFFLKCGIWIFFASHKKSLFCAFAKGILKIIGGQRTNHCTLKSPPGF